MHVPFAASYTRALRIVAVVLGAVAQLIFVIFG
jgi:hypothetical protein